MTTSSIPLKPRYNPLLWAQLRPSTRPVESDASQSVLPVRPLAPENKINTSLRVILHDTQSTLEQFADRLGNLVDGVEHAKREINKIGNCFAEGHEKLLEELNSTVNRSQQGVLEALGFPAQAAVLEEVKCSQADFNRRLLSLEDKAEIVQKQLCAISEQQGHILTSLAAITPLAPLLKDTPEQHNRILSMLTSFLPLLSLLQSLPTQIKLSQKEALESFAINIQRSDVHSSQSPKRAERSTSITRPHDFSPENRHLTSPHVVDDQQWFPEDIPSANNRQHITVCASSRTPRRETSSGIPAQTVNLQNREPILLVSSSPGLSPTLPDPYPGAPSHPVPAPPSRSTESELLRNRKRPRLSSEIDTRKDTPLHNAVAANPVTPNRNRTLKNHTSQPQLGKTITGIINKSSSFRNPVASSIGFRHLSPDCTKSAPISHNPDVLKSRPRFVGRVQPATSHAIDYSPTPDPRPPRKRPRTMGSTPMAPDYSSLSLPPVTHRGGSSNIQQEAQAPNLPGTQEQQSYSERHCLDNTPVQNLLSRKQPARRSSQQRILLDEDADEDVDIDLDWGDIGSN